MILNSPTKKVSFDSFGKESLELTDLRRCCLFFLRFTDMVPQEATYLHKATLIERWMDHLAKREQRAKRALFKEEPQAAVNTSALFLISETTSPTNPFTITPGSPLDELTHVADKFIYNTHVFGQCFLPAVSSSANVD